MNKIALAVIIGLVAIAVLMLVRKPGIMIKDDAKHSIPLEEIMAGGPPPDGIPPIDKPVFISPDKANAWLGDNEVGLSLALGNTNRFYPFQILVWHEIVNDTINGERVLVTYCPLCRTAIVFDPQVGDKRVEFGTSGKLWNSNLLMYDRQTQSLWSQVLGEAVVGEMTGTRLAILPSDIMRFGDWQKLYPAGAVLSRQTGESRPYGQDPYGDYYTTPGTIFPLTKTDNRLGDKEFVLGIVLSGRTKAYTEAAIKAAGQIKDRFANETIVGRYEQEVGAARLYRERSDGSLEQLPVVGAFWFSWAAAHPETELYK